MFRSPRRTITTLALLALTITPHPTRAADAAPLTPAAVYDAAFHLLAAGHQRGAEAVLDQAADTFPNDPRLAFFRAACTRSRFDLRGAFPLFKHVIDLDGHGTYARAAACVLLLDSRQDTPRYFATLATLVAQHSDDPLLIWMAAVQCRALEKTDEGIAYFAALDKFFDPANSLPGPVLFHQTYANLLDDADRYLDALPHRELAVKLEPADWSYNGLANTLTSLHRWPQADVAYAKNTTLNPDNAEYWHNWARSYRWRGDYNGVIEKCTRGLAANPRDASLWSETGDAQAHLNNYPAALHAYALAIDLAPNGWYAYDRSAALLTLTGRPDQAQVYRTGADALRPKRPTTAPARVADVR